MTNWALLLLYRQNMQHHLIDCSPRREQVGSKARRDELLKWQETAQQRWQAAKVFEVDAPAEGDLRQLCNS